MAENLLEAAAGILLLFVLPGYTLTKAVFPEWRLRGELALERAVETATLSFLLSVSLTVLVGFGLLNLPSVGFHADWSHPLLEAVLAAVAGVAFVAGWLRGAYYREPPMGPPLEPARGSEGGWELLRALEHDGRELRRKRHALRGLARGSSEAVRLEGEITELVLHERALRRTKESELAD